MSADELEKRHAVAEHVRPVRHRIDEHLRRHVAEGAPPARVDDAGQVPGDAEGDTEVGDMRAEVTVKQDVARLDVEVQDPPVAVFVEVRKRSGHIDGDAQPLWPSQEAPLLVTAVEDPPVQ